MRTRPDVFCDVRDVREPQGGESCDPVDSWYRYYAGYSAGFVEQALKESAEAAQLVLDPWNGTGTTTVVAASMNVRAVGFDVNPALVVVSAGPAAGRGSVGQHWATRKTMSSARDPDRPSR